MMYAIIYKPLLYCYIMLTGLLPLKSTRNMAAHPLHISTTDISYNAQDGKLEVICTIFTDDFELALAKQYNAHPDLVKPSAHAEAEALVKKYITEHVLIKPGATGANLNYLGYEIKDAAVNVYLESSKIPAPKKIDVDVSLLHNLYHDQINIVHITVNGVRKSEKLDWPNRKLGQVF
jgi:hypothetical protein